MWSCQFIVCVACVSISSYVVTGKDSDSRPFGCGSDSSSTKINSTKVGATDRVGYANGTKNTNSTDGIDHAETENVTHSNGEADKHNHTDQNHEDMVQNPTQAEPHSHKVNHTDKVSDKYTPKVPDSDKHTDHHGHVNHTESIDDKASQNTTNKSENKSTVGFWVPIFNFGDDFYFGTNKGYAKLINFPAPIIYTFLQVIPKNTRGAGAKERPQRETKTDDFSDKMGNYFDNESNFADCYVNTNTGNMIPYSYFGNWVPIFNLDNGWHLQTYAGFVPLDMNGSEVPLTYEFDPVMYRYSSVESVTTPGDSSSNTKDPGLAQWHGPVVMED